MPSRGKDQRGIREEQSSPTRFPDTTPPLPSGDYSYTVEIVMKMQHSLGQLTEAVQGLKDQQEKQAKKLDGISHKIYAAIVLLAVIGGILGFFAKSINDIVVHALLTPQQQTTSVPAAQQQPPLPSPKKSP